MSTRPVSRTAPTTLADVIEQIMSRAELPLHRRQDLVSAIRVICRLLGLPPPISPPTPTLCGRVSHHSQPDPRE